MKNISMPVKAQRLYKNAESGKEGFKSRIQEAEDSTASSGTGLNKL
jgi:hypothetical protein